MWYYVGQDRKSDFLQWKFHSKTTESSFHAKNLNLNLNDYVEVHRSLVLYDVGGLR